MCQSTLSKLFHAKTWLLACLSALVLVFSYNVSALNLKLAEQLALTDDPMVKSYLASSRAFDEQSIVDNTLPDPQFRLGLFNLPVDTFSTTQEPSTQLRLGVQQAFPKGDSLQYKQQQSRWLSKSSLAQADDENLKIIRDLREVYLNLYYELQTEKIIKNNRALFTSLVKITEAHYAAGRVKQQDVLQADLELSRLEDRLVKTLGKQDEYRAALRQWIGELAYQTMDEKLPVLPVIPDTTDINSLLIKHPAVVMQAAKVNASRSTIAIAKQGYRPGLNAFVEYRKRFGENPDGSDRADMLAAMVTLDIPLFTANRQDKQVSANIEKTSAAQFQLDNKLRVLKRLLEKDLAVYKRLGQRQKLYHEELLASAKNNAEASLRAYQSGVTEFTTLMRSRMTELDVKLADLRVRVDRSRAKARLLYLTGEAK
ncbi:TolC family protein [Cardiobacterium sp. AH-315-I02]|nr:TolC family protein [Cardiobacterium sp. AH-315-I02]